MPINSRNCNFNQQLGSYVRDTEMSIDLSGTSETRRISAGGMKSQIVKCTIACPETVAAVKTLRAQLKDKDGNVVKTHRSSSSSLAQQSTVVFDLTGAPGVGEEYTVLCDSSVNQSGSAETFTEARAVLTAAGGWAAGNYAATVFDGETYTTTMSIVEINTASANGASGHTLTIGDSGSDFTDVVITLTGTGADVEEAPAIVAQCVTQLNANAGFAAAGYKALDGSGTTGSDADESFLLMYKGETGTAAGTGAMTEVRSGGTWTAAVGGPSAEHVAVMQADYLNQVTNITATRATAVVTVRKNGDGAMAGVSTAEDASGTWAATADSAANYLEGLMGVINASSNYAVTHDNASEAFAVTHATVNFPFTCTASTTGASTGIDENTHSIIVSDASNGVTAGDELTIEPVDQSTNPLQMDVGDTCQLILTEDGGSSGALPVQVSLLMAPALSELANPLGVAHYEFKFGPNA